MRTVSTVVALFLFLTLQVSIPHLAAGMTTGPTAVMSSDSLGHYEGNGPSAPVSWTGDGQVLNNPSFETGLAPWTATWYNAGPGSIARTASPGYGDSNSAQVTLFSRNLTIGSNYNLVYDLSRSQVGFNPSARFRATVFVQNITGNTSLDRVEITFLLSTSLGSLRTLHYVFAAGAVPPNSATDVYVRAPGFNTLGRWLSLDVNLAGDASAFADASIIDSVQQISLTAMAQTYGRPNHDPHIKYVESDNNTVWDLGETVVYDTNLSGVYYTGRDQVLYPGTMLPANNTVLRDDPLIRYVDTNGNGVWDTGEPIIYDKNGNGIYEFGEPSIYGTTPDSGTLVMTPVVKTTSALFDQVELYTASGGTDWIVNGGFENVSTSSQIVGWSYNASFTSSTTKFLAGSRSAQGTVMNGGGEMAQSIDARPQIDSTTLFKASVNVDTMYGSTSGDIVDIWLGLVDSKANPASVYYYFKTGDGTIPSNRTDTTYHRAPRFGTMTQWLSLAVPLIQEEARFNGLGFTPPYSVELVAVELGAAGGASLTTAYFDQLSLFKPGYSKSGSVQPYFYANVGQNSTYVYTLNNVSQGYVSLQLPLAQEVLNITAPEGTILQQASYTISTSATTETITIPPTAFFNHAPMGTWKVYTTASNSATNLYAQDPNTQANLTTVPAGYPVNLVAQAVDPLGNPIALATVNITLSNSAGIAIRAWAGNSDNQGTWTATGVILLPYGSPAGNYTLQATINASYVGVRTTRLTIITVLLPVTITLAVSAGNVSQGNTVTISGSVVNTGTGTVRPGLAVTIYYRQAGNATWISLTIVTTDSAGRYSYTWSPLQGQYQLRATVGNSQTPTTTSNTSPLVVGPPGQNPVSPTSSFPWIFVILGATGGAAIIIALLFLTRRRQPPPE